MAPGVYPGDPSQGLPTITLLYPNGATWRNSVVTISMSPNVTKPTIQFVSESPYLQYNINMEVG